MKRIALANKMSVFKRFGSQLSVIGVALGMTLVGAWAGIGCSEAQEGDRCNPLLSHNDCNSGLACTAASQGPPTPYSQSYYELTINPNSSSFGQFSPNAPCAENYCCPIGSASTNPNCQPGCNGGAAFVCVADPSAGPDVDGGAGYVCEVAAAIEAGTAIPDGAPEPAEAESDASSEAAPDAGGDATVEAEASVEASVDAPSDAPEAGE